jgi:hypothetical protein
MRFIDLRRPKPDGRLVRKTEAAAPGEVTDSPWNMRAHPRGAW